MHANTKRDALHLQNKTKHAENGERGEVEEGGGGD